MNSLCKMLEMYDIFVFDVDDTLLYTFRNGYRKMQIVAKTLGYSGLDFDEYAACYGVLSFEECIAKWFPKTAVPEAVQAYRETSAQVPYEAICNFAELQYLLLRNGKESAILTNGRNDARLIKKLKVCRVNMELLAGLWGAEELPAPKPSGLSIQPVKDQFPTRSIIYIGDSAVDKETAQAAGVGFLQVCTGKDKPFPGIPSINSLQHLIDQLTIL